ncbi:hypothetical protein F0562_004233 [Nyssa sinensis]|uniref:Uncharacterized protein n=1 Tax=Nyssa sinensis TaxID=561372 RepID=A0A5J5BYS7_9ASTE|nr:hypothetical protein F0562_004233 [Nyssa sinensis]
MDPVGLLWSGSWSLCQTAVEAVLKGAPIVQIASEAAECSNGPPLKAYDIRHVSKEDNSNDLHRVRTRCRFKRSAGRPKANRNCVGSADESCRDELNRSSSHESSLSHQSVAAPNVEGERRETESLASEETAEASLLYGVEPESVTKPSDEADDGEIELELTLGFEPASRGHSVNPKNKRTNDTSYSSDDDGDCKMELGLH